MKRRNQQDSAILWLSNTMRLVHILKQYSGEPAFSNDNTTKQNSQVLQNFDLADYRQVFCDHAVLLYQVSVKYLYIYHCKFNTEVFNFDHKFMLIISGGLNCFGL